MESKIVRANILICLFLIIAILTVYHVWNHAFINLDDNVYVTENKNVTTGLTLNNLLWSFRTAHAANWHPLTWLSHMLDCQLYGMDAGSHHSTSVLIHIFNSLLLFLIFWKMTGDVWQCGFVATIFALHPLHVESVAWIAERKDVLSAFFWMLTLWSYVRYSEQPDSKKYIITLCLFILGLMAKPMLVTLPFVLLLLDYWPLKRFHSFHSFVEKIPFFIVSGISSIITFFAQQGGGAVRSLAIYPLSVRIGNALVSYVQYLWKMIFPYHLTVLYPHPGMPPGWKIAGAFLLLVFIFLLAIMTVKKHPYLMIGWLWYIGTLVPVIGLVQVGSQAMADRYTYLPLIGISIIIAWGVPSLIPTWRYKRVVFAAIAAVLFSAFMAVTHLQVGYWKNSITLFKHAIESTTENYQAHHNLGVAFADQKNFDEAIKHYSEALRIHPDFAIAHNNLGNALREQGRDREAIEHYYEALSIDPNHALSHYNLGRALKEQGNISEAIEHYLDALRIQPGFVLAHNNLGNALKEQGKISEAIEQYYMALRVDPCHALSHFNLANTLASQGHSKRAMTHFQEALRIKPDYSEAQRSLELILQKSF
ncbi:MAG: tetratricopeptide repeat protein [bacterium]